MKKGIIGKKIGMTQIFDEIGNVIPVTVIEAGPCVVAQKKTAENDGYDAVQLGFIDAKEKHMTKPEIGHFAKGGVATKKHLKEFRLDDCSALNVGDVVAADTFVVGDKVDVTGTTKGRGFQGVVKRYRFGGGRASHGGDWTRRTGSIGCREWPGNIIKGKRMPGHMGNVQRTVQNLKVVRVMLEDNCLLVRGAVPGPNGGTLILRSAIKSTNK